MKCDKCNNTATSTSQISKYKLCEACYEEQFKALLNKLNTQKEIKICVVDDAVKPSE